MVRVKLKRQRVALGKKSLFLSDDAIFCLTTDCFIVDSPTEAESSGLVIAACNAQCTETTQSDTTASPTSVRSDIFRRFVVFDFFLFLLFFFLNC
jgi:hypothetical protein